MRLLIDSLIAMMLLGILAAVLLYHRERTQDLEQIRRTHQALAQLQEQALYRSALGEEVVERSPIGFPLRIEPAWFSNKLPRNALVSGDRPWLDIAPPGDMSDQPPDPVILGPDQAAFWYNPNRGIFRARVMPQVSEQSTLELYNQANNTAMPSLPPAAQQRRAAGTLVVIADTAQAAAASTLAREAPPSDRVSPTGQAETLAAPRSTLPPLPPLPVR
ncbi:MAG TPA: hypothetical protein VF184_00265 [Phycisphaeraceae bacterium]